MTSLLTALRQNAPRVTATCFLAAHPASWILYYDDSPARDSGKALSARTFDPAVARRKQRERCAVGFSLQPFGERRTKDQLLCFRTLGVDVDLIAPPARMTMTGAAIDARKEQYLRSVLAPFPLRPHWLIETRHGFHLLFRVEPVREPKSVAEAVAVNRRLVVALRGDPNAVLLTQLLRVPGTLQFKVPSEPFLCRLLLDNTASVLPYPLATVRDALGGRSDPAPPTAGQHEEAASGRVTRWRQGLSGVAEGERNATAASLVGKILGRLPEELWEMAGWGGLREWNRRNAVPLPERELRAVFESIARREQGREARQTPREASRGPTPLPSGSPDSSPDAPVSPSRDPSC